jgi:hypothetical protein
LDLQEALTLLAILVALFGREFVQYLKRPILKPDFVADDSSYFHEIHFPLFKHGRHMHYSKGRNCLLKISNPKRMLLPFLTTDTAKGCEVKITYIFDKDRNLKHTYHPTWLKWSGIEEEKPVSIMSGSHHFLDFIRFYNYEDTLWIEDDYVTMGFTKSAIPPSSPPAENPLPEEKLYFQPWIPGRHSGIKKFFSGSGTYDIHFVINAENCDPQEYVATLKWSRSNWDKSKIEIRIAKDHSTN